MSKTALRQWVVVLALIATVVINGLANALPLNGQTTGEISDRFKVFFVPAGYVFSIWGVIYLWLAGYAVFQALPAQRQNPRLMRIGYLFALACVANTAWLFLWHFELFELSVIAMLALLALLIAIYLWLGIGRLTISTGERWLVHVAFSIYLGWVTVATIANVTSLLEYLRWGGWGISGQTWAVIMLVVAALLGTAVGLARRDAAYLLVLMWAFSGIGVKHADTSTVAIAAWGVTAWTGIILVATFVRGGGKTLAPTSVA